jgi:hypothetical protein
MVSRVNNNVDMAPVGRVTLVQQLQNCMPLATGAAGSLNWVPIAGGFTPTSALVAALQAQGPGIAPRAPLFFGVRPPTTNRAEGADQAPMIMLQMHDPNNLMRTSGFISVQHPVDVGMVTAYYTPHPPLARQQLKDRLEEVRADLYDTGRCAPALLLRLRLSGVIRRAAASGVLGAGCLRKAPSELGTVSWPQLAGPP